MNSEMQGTCESVLWGLSVGWLVVAAAAADSLLRGLRNGERKQNLRLFTLFGGSLLLRLGMATWGPGNDQFRYQNVFAGSGFARSWQPTFCDEHLGSAPLALWHWVMQILPATDTTIISFVLFFGALAPLLLTLVLLGLRATPLAAYGAGLLLAIHPVAVRFSGDMSRTPVALALGLLALYFLTLHRRQGRILPLLGFAAAVWLSARSRPEGGMVLLVAGILVLVLHTESWRSLRSAAFWREAAALLLAAVLAVGNLIVASHMQPAIAKNVGEIFQHLNPSLFTPRLALWLDPGYTSLATIALAAVGVSVAFRASLARHRRIAAWALASLVLATLLRPSGPSHQLILVYARYQWLQIVFFCVLAALGVQEILQRSQQRWGQRGQVTAGALLAIGVLGGNVDPLLNVCRPITIDQEYHFLAKTLPTLPSCAVIYRPFDPAVDLSGGFRDTDLLAAHFGRQPWRTWPPDPKDGACVRYFYRSPDCYVTPAYVMRDYPQSLFVLKNCAQGIHRTSARPRKVTQVDGRRWGPETYVLNRFEIGFYEIALPAEVSSTR